MAFFQKSSEQKKQAFTELRETFSSWKNEVHQLNKPFFAIHSDFKHLFLKDLSGGAMKLYVFLGLHSKYQTGESWYSAKDVAEFFEKDSRTVSNWFKELEDTGLIVREQQGFKMKANTFLRPYGFVIEVLETGLESGAEDVYKDFSIQHIKNEHVPYFGLLLNYAFKEFTFLMIYKNNNANKHQDALFHVSCFLNFSDVQIPKIRQGLKNRNIDMDNYDADYPVGSSKYKKLTIYSLITRYLDSEGKNFEASKQA